MSALCYERPGIPFRTKPAPRLAMDAALQPEPDYAGNLIEALINFATTLDPDKKAALENLIESQGDPRATVAKDEPPVTPRSVAPANVARAVAILRSQDVDEDLIKQVCAAVGASVPGMKDTQAMDAAIRSRSYRARFPEATRLGGEPLTFDQSTESSTAYDKMFPEAARLS